MSWKISAVLPSCLPPPPHPLFRSLKIPFSQPFCLWGLLWLLSFPSLKSDSRFSFYLYLWFSSYLMVLFLYLTQIYRELILANFLMWAILFVTKWLPACVSTIYSIFYLKVIQLLKIKSKGVLFLYLGLSYMPSLS